MPTEVEIVSFFEKYGLLKSGQSPWPSFNPKGLERYRVDWNTLFPRRQRMTKNGEYEWDIYGDDWIPELGEEFQQDLEEAVSAHPPTKEEITEMAESNKWDTCAWYQPIHYFGYDWGIYVQQDCLLSQALRIARFLPKHVRPSRGLTHALIRASAYAYFLHEQYHHKVESLAIRLEVVKQATVYLSYHKKVYSPTMGSDRQLEEALANANSYHRLRTDPYERWISPPMVDVTRSYLRATFRYEPPGYRMAIRYLGITAFGKGENLLHARVHEASLQPKQPSSDWAIATRLIQSLFKVTDNIWMVITPGGRRIMPAQPWP